MTAADRTSQAAKGDEAGRSRLGRGLAALIGDAETQDVGGEPARGLRQIPVAFIAANPRNPRRLFRDEDLADLAESIRQKGIVQPILVRPSASEADHYEIVAGERRWRAAQRAGLHEVPVLIRDLDDRQALEVAIIENVQRADLNPIEEAEGYQRLLDEFKYSQADLGEMIGKSRSHVANMLRLLKLPGSVRQYLVEGKLSAGHARSLLTMDDPAAAARRIVDEGMSVRKVEDLARKGAPASRRKTGGAEEIEKDADTLALERALGDALGMGVLVQHRGGRGEVRIAYRSLEQLDHLCKRLQGRG